MKRPRHGGLLRLALGAALLVGASNGWAFTLEPGAFGSGGGAGSSSTFASQSTLGQASPGGSAASAGYRAAVGYQAAVWTARVVALPGAPVVPTTSVSGSYSISWARSVTVGAEYELQEATNAAFTAGLRTVYSGGSLSADVTGRPDGTYYYRVSARKNGRLNSAWMAGANGCAVSNAPPVLATIGGRVIEADGSVRFSVSASDPGGGAVTLGATGLPPGATFSGGVFSWRPSAGQTGSHTVTFTASDGTLTTSEAVTVRVTAAPAVGWRYLAGDRSGSLSVPVVTRPQSGSFSAAWTQPLPAGESDTATGDLDGDGRLDLVTVGGKELHLSYGDVTKPAVEVTLPADSHRAILEDITGDGVAEILVGTTNGASQVLVYRGDGVLDRVLEATADSPSGVAHTLYPITAADGVVYVGLDNPGTDPRGYGAVDLGGVPPILSGYYDVGPRIPYVAAAEGPAGIEVLGWARAGGTAAAGTTGAPTDDLNVYAIVAGPGGYERTVLLSSGLGSSRQALVDLDADGVLEVVAAVNPDDAAAADTVRVVRSTDGALLANRTVAGGDPVTVVFDVDGDGVKDVAVSTATGDVLLLDKDLNVLRSASGLGTLLSAGDLDGDGVPELLVAGGSTLKVVDAADLTVEWSLAVGGAGAPALQAAFASDVNGDGYAELVVTQPGLVTVLQSARHSVSTAVNPAAGGSVVGGGSYAAGDTARLTAVASAGYRFTGWSGGATGTANPVDVLVSGDLTVTANFVRRYTLTVAPNNPAYGTATGGGTYDSGKVVKLTATPAAGYRFVTWTGAYVGTTNPVNVTANADKSYTANFAPVGGYFLTALTSPVSGAGTLAGGGVYLPGKVALLTATPNSAAGYYFAGWKEYPASTANPLRVTMNADKTVTAKFAQPYAVAVSSSPAAGGSVTGGGTYIPLATVTLTAAANPGYRFGGWSGSFTGLTNPLVFKADGAKSVTAKFVRQYTITAAASPAAGGSVTGGGIYDAGKVVTLTATANPGYRFVTWTGSYTGTANPVKVTASSDKALTAVFEPAP